MASEKQDFDNALEKIFRRAATDDAFRRLCVTDAKAAYKAATGAVPPSGLKLRLIENEGDELTIVLPNKTHASGEVADDALAQVAGGGIFADIYYGCDRTCRASAGSNVVAACGPENPH